MALFFTVFGCIAVVVSGALFAAAEVSRRSKGNELAQDIRRAASGSPGPKKKVAAVAVLDDEAAVRSFQLDQLPPLPFLARQIKAAGMDWQPGATALAMAGLAVLGVVLGNLWPFLIYPAASMVGAALALGCVPYVVISRKRDKRLYLFESQFPDSLDFFARAVRAGHAFSVSLELMANESPEPTRTEFRRVFTEHQLGSSLDSALQGLAERVPSIDTRFFVSAILLQRETGGNLSEMLESLSSVIRERFQLKGKVRASSAHGRMTAMALTIIPIALLMFLMLTRPGYLKPMTEDHHGRMMLLGALIGQIVGYFVMKRLVNFKV